MILNNFQDWDASEEPVDFRKISTPSTTYVSVFAFDERYPEEAPPTVWKTLPPLFQKFSDNVSVFKNYEATDEKLISELSSGKSRHFFICYMFGHGLTDQISMWSPSTNRRRNVKAVEIWQALNSAKKRFILIFDACYSGSQTDISEAELSSFAASNAENTEAPVVYGEFTKMFMQYQKFLCAASGPTKPMFQVWSSTIDKHYSYYEPGSSTYFSRALAKTINKSDGMRLSDFWALLEKNGSMNTSRSETDAWYIKPQKFEYGEDFNSCLVR